MKIIRRIIFQWRKYISIKASIRAHDADGRKYLVIILEGKPTMVAKGELRKWMKRGVFKNGVTLQDFEKRALFVSK
jgi:hypothetical protein